MEPVNFGAQLALFHSPQYLTGGTVDVPKLMHTHFVGELSITPIPIPNDAPADIPRYQIRLGDLVFNFTNIRADMISESADLTDIQIKNFLEVVTNFGVTIDRIGYVLNKRYENVPQNFLESNLNLTSPRFTDTELVNVTEASWRINKKKPLGAAGNCNNMSTLTLEVSETGRNVILVRDVNTEQDRSLQLSTVPETLPMVTLLKDEALRSDNIVPPVI